MTTPDLHFCLGSDCPGLEAIPSRAEPHPETCRATSYESACCFEDRRKPEPFTTHFRRALDAVRRGDDDAAYIHMLHADQDLKHEERIARYTRDLEAQQPPEDMP